MKKKRRIDGLKKLESLHERMTSASLGLDGKIKTAAEAGKTAKDLKKNLFKRDGKVLIAKEKTIKTFDGFSSEDE